MICTINNADVYLGAGVTHLRAGDDARHLAPALAMLAIDAAYLAAALPFVV